MPQVKVLIYCEGDDTAPLLQWLDRQPDKVKDNCTVRMERPKALGHELRWPEVDYLPAGIYQLRTRVGRVNYRLLYHGCTAAVLTHGFTKEGQIPDADIERAIASKVRFERNPEKHTYRES